jgi:hypothetical protein
VILSSELGGALRLGSRYVSGLKEAEARKRRRDESVCNGPRALCVVDLKVRENSVKSFAVPGMTLRAITRIALAQNSPPNRPPTSEFLVSKSNFLAKVSAV